MAATVLNSAKAVEMSVYIVRAFVRMSETIATDKAISEKLTGIERKLSQHDEDIRAVVQVIRQLMAPEPLAKKRRIGFRKDD